MKLFIVAACLACTAAIAQAETLIVAGHKLVDVSVGSNDSFVWTDRSGDAWLGEAVKSNEGGIWLLRPDNYAKNRGWLMFVKSSTTTSDTKSGLLGFDIDCDRFMVKNVYAAAYKDFFAKGTPTHPKKNDDKYIVPGPGTYVEYLARFICQRPDK
mgnify:CR=1 FL=1